MKFTGGGGLQSAVCSSVPCFCTGRKITWVTVRCGHCALHLKTLCSSTLACLLPCWLPAVWRSSSAPFRWSMGCLAACVEHALRRGYVGEMHQFIMWKTQSFSFLKKRPYFDFSWILLFFPASVIWLNAATCWKHPALPPHLHLRGFQFFLYILFMLQHKLC